MGREALLARAFVELADTLVDNFDVVDLLTHLTERCVETLDISTAGVMLVALEGDLRVVASSSETMRMLELFELQYEEGPCLDCYRSGDAVLNQDLAASSDRWARFTPVALDAGFRMVHALPMRLRGSTIGVLNLFLADLRSIEAADALAGQALADVATIAILQHRAALEAQTLSQQLAYALNSRITIEQAKGVLAERGRVNMDVAFAALRNHARSHNLKLHDVAEQVIEGTLAAPKLALFGDPPSLA